VAKKRTTGRPDKATRDMVRGPADEAAVRAGCRFDEERAAHAVEWIETSCKLYEGDAAGQYMKLADWQLDATRRLFGWVTWSDDWNREVRRFLRASIWIPKKNGKSPTLAAWGLYLLVADGEPGQKVYSVARDGKQARISHRHAVEMVERSEDLRAACTPAKQTMHITYHPTSSTYTIVAGDNRESQEGLNGSVMVDETHVVDRRLMNILKYAGASRSEPLHVEVSTAGNNPDGYGKSQWERAQRIESGDEIDHRTLAISYQAPQDLSDEQLAEDPERYGRMANPTWGRIVRPGEFMAAYEQARHSPSDLAEFMMYRLNVWQRSANPWLRASDWQACERKFTLADFEGRDCWAGLDLSRTRDMSSLVICSRGTDEGTFDLVPFFWLPQERADKLNHLFPFRAWAAAGFLELTPGNVVDFGYIKSRFRSLCERLNLCQLWYDPKFAEEVTQSLEQGETDAAGKQVAEGTGVERVSVGQMKAMVPLTADFERHVLAHTLRHDGNPVMTWQAGHAQVRRVNGDKRVVKPEEDGPRTIDGVVAAIMALGAAARGDGSSASVYESRGILYL
jgi:phage terminase large subunit-like protein